MQNATVLVPMMLFGWIPITIIAFWVLRPHHAVLFSVIGGWLFLPMAAYDFPGIPEYAKNSAISLALILGSVLSGNRRGTVFRFEPYDIPIIIWCLCPVATSLSNHLGFYDGLSESLANLLSYGVPFFIGRYYFDSAQKIRDFYIAIIIGGIIYLPMCWYEIRMSPQLHTLVYGFFQHSFEQHIRYGGFRPIIFLQHGLMVSLWMALCAVITFWFWRNLGEKYLLHIPISIFFIAFTITTILCKSANGWAILILGISLCLFNQFFKSVILFRILILLIPSYILLRIPDLLSTQDITAVVSTFLDEERVTSLLYRLNQEELISREALKRPLLGWGGYGRGLPRDMDTGQILIRVRDSLWLITFQTHGVIGLGSLYFSLLLGPWLIVHNYKKLIASDNKASVTIALGLAMLLIFFSLDSLFNSMKSPLYITIAGALISCYTAWYRDEFPGISQKPDTNPKKRMHGSNS